MNIRSSPGYLELEDLLAGDHPLPGRDGRRQAAEQRGLVLPACVPPDTRTFSPLTERGLEEPGCLPRQRPEMDEVLQMRCPDDELADVHRREGESYREGSPNTGRHVRSYAMRHVRSYADR